MNLRRLCLMCVALVLASGLGGSRVVDAAAPSSDSCGADTELGYVCGAGRPEDILAIPGTRWLVASGFEKGSGLKLIDGQSHALTRWYTGSPDQVAPDLAAYPRCPGAVDPALFNDRGLSLRQIGDKRWRLLVVNHGGHEAVEVFEVDTAADRPTISWRGCLPMPPGQVGNAVTQTPDNEVLVTVLTRPGTTIADFVEGRKTGAVWSWRPGMVQFEELPGTDLPGNNGIESAPDGKRFYVIAFGWHAVVVFDRANTRQPAAIIPAPDFMPDNIHWSGGHLLLAGMRLDEPACGGLRRVLNGVADPMECHRGWVVGEVDLSHGRIATFAYGTPRPSFNGLSAAAISGENLWLGSYQADRVAFLKAGVGH